MIRRPPRSTLFPYTTLFRSVLIMSVNPGFAGQQFIPNALRKLAAARARIDSAGRAVRLEVDGRSEEHTSELQSQSNLVCRLLLEKKKHPLFGQDGTLLGPTH